MFSDQSHFIGRTLIFRVSMRNWNLKWLGSRKLRGAWVAQSAKHLTSAQVMISQSVGSSASGSVLTAQSLEPASDSVSSSLCPFPAHTLSLSVSKINKCKIKKKRLETSVVIHLCSYSKKYFLDTYLTTFNIQKTSFIVLFLCVTFYLRTLKVLCQKLWIYHWVCKIQFLISRS